MFVVEAVLTAAIIIPLIAAFAVVAAFLVPRE